HAAARGLRRPAVVDLRRAGAPVPAAAIVQKVSVGRADGRTAAVSAPGLLRRASNRTEVGPAGRGAGPARPSRGSRQRGSADVRPVVALPRLDGAPLDL